MTREDSTASVTDEGPVSSEDNEIVKLAGDLAGLRPSDNDIEELKGATAAAPVERSNSPTTSQEHEEEEQEEAAHVMDDEDEDGDGPCHEKTPANEDCFLFIGDLARAVTEADIEKAFSAVGTVVAVDIKRDRQTMRNLGYGFVQLSSKQEAEEAKEKMHEKEILGRKIRVGRAERNTSLFIGDLDEAITNSALQDAFRRFGSLCENQTYVRPGKFGRHGYVKFKTRTHAETARKEMNGCRLGAYPIRVVWHHSTSGNICAQAGTTRPFSVYVQFETEANETVTEEILRSIFAPFGEVIGAVLPQGGGTFIDGEGGARKGYGFIHFTGTPLGRRCAMEAIRGLHGQLINGIQISCTLAKKPMSNLRPVSGGPRGGGIRPLPRSYSDSSDAGGGSYHHAQQQHSHHPQYPSSHDHHQQFHHHHRGSSPTGLGPVAAGGQGGTLGYSSPYTLPPDGGDSLAPPPHHWGGHSQYPPPPPPPPTNAGMVPTTPYQQTGMPYNIPYPYYYQQQQYYPVSYGQQAYPYHYYPPHQPSPQDSMAHQMPPSRPYNPRGIPPPAGALDYSMQPPPPSMPGSGYEIFPGP